MFEVTLRLSANRSASGGSHHNVPDHTLTLNNSSRRKGRLRGLPLTFSSSAPAQRNQSDDLPLARGAQVQALPSSCIELWPALRLILITPASVRRTCIFAPSTCAIDRLSKCRLQAYRKCPSHVWAQCYLYPRIAQK